MNNINYYNLINNIDLKMYYCGTEQCKPSHSWGPAIKEHFKIHYIHKGKGVFKVGDRTYFLGEGQGFLICPDVISYYKADNEDPWAYSWCAFNGFNAKVYLKRANLTLEQPIFKYDKSNAISSCFKDMIEASVMEKSKDLRLQSLLYLFLAMIIDEVDSQHISNEYGKRKDNYINAIIEFIAFNYSRKIKISEMADYIGLDRKYLSVLFKNALGVNLQQYLINFRIQKACGLMKDRSLSIGDISRSVGYDNPLMFSKMFKSVKKVSPRQYRDINYL